MEKIEKALQMCLSHPSFNATEEGIRCAYGYFEFVDEWFKDGAYSDYESYVEGEDKEPTYWWITAVVDEIKDCRNIFIEAFNDEELGKIIMVSTRGSEVENRIDMELVEDCKSFDEVVSAVNKFLSNMDDFSFEDEPEDDEDDDM